MREFDDRFTVPGALTYGNVWNQEETTPDNVKAFISHSLAEARREERERILTMAHNIRSELKEPGYISLTRLEDLLTGDNPERKV